MGNVLNLHEGFDRETPYLYTFFLIVTHILSRLIQGAVDGGFLEGIYLSMQGPTLSHLLFADDTLIFLRASSLNYQNIIQILNAYCTTSGQEVSMQKSSIFFGANTPEGIRDKLVIILGMPQVMDPGNYLGIPTT